MRHLAYLALLSTLFLPLGVHAQSTDPDILCENAPPGSVAEIPQPVAQWVIILCTEEGQTLVPRLREEVEMWLETGTAIPFQLPAAPPGVLDGSPRKSKYDLRFERFSTRLATGPQRNLLLELWQRAYRQADVPPEVGDVYQLDVVSAYRGQLSNLFIYLRGDEPRWIVFCREQCRIGVPLDVLRGEELDARVAAQELRTR